MSEPSNKRVKRPPLADHLNMVVFPREALERIHTRLSEKCLCSLSLNEIVTTFTVCNQVFASSTFEIGVDENRVNTLLYVSMLTLFFELSLRQQNRGIVCSRISQVVAMGTENEAAILDVLFCLLSADDTFVSYSASRAISSLLVMLHGRASEVVMQKVVLSITTSDNLLEISHSLQLIARVIDWKDFDDHPLESESEASHPQACQCLTTSPGEAQGPNEVKHVATKTLDAHWPLLVGRLTRHVIEFTTEKESLVVSFLSLWESLISVRANLSVTDTRDFHCGLERLLSALTRTSHPLVWAKVLDLYNEVLCYSSTLALQEVLPEEPCSLAHLLVRAVKDRHLLECLPCLPRGGSARSLTGPGGPPPQMEGGSSLTEMFSCEEETTSSLIHKVVLVMVKSIAITVRETRCDSSSGGENSSLSGGSGSEDRDLAIIEGSLRQVARQLDSFVKARLPFHPEATMADWMVRLFADQDDWLIEAMVCGLDIHCGLSSTNIRQQYELCAVVEPHTSFLVFLETICYDHDVLLDLLVSNETSFLLYLLRYLKVVRRTWGDFVLHCGRNLEVVMTTLTRLRLAVDRLVSKKLFPYNIGPVLRLLEKCEDQYEVQDA